ncbi:MAG: single-stranded DNA-binding protein [Candidatus Diapherotrites archaeon]|nr:single-stranded DNA-binding protein [Candidatus Micrarchaeota archaeon]MBU1939594.1 single-stranded DNA-binding protein [Candidatus Micrarchaeota archaeon]
MDVAEIKPFSKKVDVTVKVLDKNEVREVTSKLDNSQHKVTEALVGDATGTILLTLWDDAIESIEVGKSYAITNGYTSTFKDSLRLNIGRYGEFKEAEKEVAEVKEDNNISGEDKE